MTSRRSFVGALVGGLLGVVGLGKVRGQEKAIPPVTSTPERWHRYTPRHSDWYLTFKAGGILHPGEKVFISPTEEDTVYLWKPGYKKAPIGTAVNEARRGQLVIVSIGT